MLIPSPPPGLPSQDSLRPTQSSTPKQTPVIVNIGTFQNQSTHEMMRDSRKLAYGALCESDDESQNDAEDYDPLRSAMGNRHKLLCYVRGIRFKAMAERLGILPPKSVILQSEAKLLRQVLNSRQAALPPKATERLADAPHRRSRSANTIGQSQFCGRSPWCGRGLPTSDTDFAFLYWVCAINSCDPITPKPFYYLGILWKLAQYRDRPGLNIVTEISCATPCQNSLIYFAALARLVWSDDVLPQDKEDFLARSRNAPKESLMSKLCCETFCRNVNSEAGVNREHEGSMSRSQRERNGQHTGPDKQEAVHDMEPGDGGSRALPQHPVPALRQQGQAQPRGPQDLAAEPVRPCQQPEPERENSPALRDRPAQSLPQDACGRARHAPVNPVLLKTCWEPDSDQKPGNCSPRALRDERLLSQAWRPQPAELAVRAKLAALLSKPCWEPPGVGSTRALRDERLLSGGQHAQTQDEKSSQAWRPQPAKLAQLSGKPCWEPDQEPSDRSPLALHERDDDVLLSFGNQDDFENADSESARVNFMQNEEKRLWKTLSCRPKVFSSASYGTTSFSPLPGAAELAEAKQLFQTKTNDNDLAVELLRHKPACWQPEALYLLGRCVESGRGVPICNAELASLLIAYFEEVNAAINYGEHFRARKPCWYLKKLAGLVWDEDDVLLGYRESFLARSRKAPQTSLLSKLTWRAAWLSRPVSTYAMQLSVEMQQFAGSLKQERLLQPEDYAKDFRSFFRFEAEPTTYFWRDLSDVLGRWWGRTDTHAAVRVTAMRAVLPSEDVLVEHTQVIELQRLRKKYKKLVPRTRYNKKQNLCKVWEQDCTEAMDEEQFQRLLLPRGSALDQTAGRGDASSTVRQVPDCGALIRGCFEPADGDFFVRWLAQQVRAWRPVQDRPVQKRPAQSWVYLVGQVPLLLKQILRSFCRILGDEHVVVFRHAKDHDSARKKNAELQQSLLVVVDGCSRQAHEGQRKELLKVLRSDCKVPGNEGGGRTRPINLSPWRQVLVLPEANGESLWTSDQLRQKGLAVTVARLAAPASSSESLTDVPSSEELA
eukprot:g48177.t1